MSKLLAKFLTFMERELRANRLCWLTTFSKRLSAAACRPRLLFNDSRHPRQTNFSDNIITAYMSFVNAKMGVAS